METEHELPPVDTGATVHQTVGARLKAARLARDLDLSDVARDTRIPVRHLAAIEADEHENLPALPYAIGFVKSFARIVGLSPEALGDQFRAETSKQPLITAPMSIEPLDEGRVPPRGVVIASLIVLAVLILGISGYLAGWFDSPTPQVAESAAPAEMGDDAAAVPVLATEQPVVPAPDVAVIAPAADAASPAPAPATVAAAAPAVDPAAVAGQPVVLTAREDAWIKIYTAPGVPAVRMGVLKAGERYEVPGDVAGLKLWTGKAGAIAVTVGGKAIAPLGGPAQTVRDVSLAPADLLARASVMQSRENSMAQMAAKTSTVSSSCYLNSPIMRDAFKNFVRLEDRFGMAARESIIEDISSKYKISPDCVKRVMVHGIENNWEMP